MFQINQIEKPEKSIPPVFSHTSFLFIFSSVSFSLFCLFVCFCFVPHHASCMHISSHTIPNKPLLIHSAGHLLYLKRQDGSRQQDHGRVISIQFSTPCRSFQTAYLCPLWSLSQDCPPSLSAWGPTIPCLQHGGKQTNHLEAVETTRHARVELDNPEIPETYGSGVPGGCIGGHRSEPVWGSTGVHRQSEVSVPVGVPRGCTGSHGSGPVGGFQGGCIGSQGSLRLWGSWVCTESQGQNPMWGIQREKCSEKGGDSDFIRLIHNRNLSG